MTASTHRASSLDSRAGRKMNKIRRGAVIWAAAGALLLAWFGLAAGVNAGTNDEVKDAIAQQGKAEHFYRVVAGDISGQEPGPANRLARDLRELSEEEIISFAGDNNRYGGISEELGFDPFNGVDCSECGPLDTQVIFDVQAVKDGDLEGVLDRLESEVPKPDEMSGPPLLLWFLWFVSFPVTVGIKYVQRQRSEEDKYRDFPDERELLAQLREAKSELPPGHQEWLALDQLADQLQEQIDLRVSYKHRKTKEMKLEALTQEASSRLEEIEAGNKTLE